MSATFPATTIPPIASAAESTPSRRDEFIPEMRAEIIVDAAGSVISSRKYWTFPSTISCEEPGVFVGRVLALPGCFSQGSTYDEAKANLSSALSDILALHRRDGTTPKFETPEADEMPARCDVFPLHVDVSA